MTQTLTDILGANATSTGSTITIDLADFKHANGTQMLDTPATASASKKIATLIAGIYIKAKQAKDANGVEIVDKTNVLVSSDSFSPKTFEVRQDVSQIKNEFVFSLYTVDATTFDPDNAV
jgi:isocitrate/isopropylmalate dehydrogenase